jgi:glucose-6-phosphate dehydrogenase assembly protein OpcA
VSAARLVPGRPAVRRQWQGDSINLSEVVSQIDKLQVEISRLEAAEDEHITSRSKVLELVVVASDEREAERVAAIVSDLADRHPCRAVIVLDQPGGEDRIDAAVTVAASTQISCDMCQYEEVFLRVRGRAAEHIPSLVESLAVADVPAFLWWTGSPPIASDRFREALSVADAALVDSAAFIEPARTFVELVNVRRKMRGEMLFSDFAWGRVHPWRELLAQFFNPADRRLRLSGIREVQIEHAGSNSVAASLLAGWLAAVLRWRLEKVSGGRGGVSLTYSRSGRSIEVELRRAAAEDLSEGEIAALTMAASSDGRSCRLVAKRHSKDKSQVESTGTIDDRPLASRVVPMERADESTLLSHLLVTCRSDDLFARASDEAAEVLARSAM